MILYFRIAPGATSHGDTEGDEWSMQQLRGMRVFTGPITDETANDRGWLVGGFKELDSPFRTQSFEFKHDTAEAGKSRPREEAAADARNWTLQLVISGRVRTSFPVENGEDIHVEVGPGELCLWGPGVLHYWEILESGLVQTLRWPE